MMKQPLVVSYGMGVDSTAMLVGMVARGIRPDAILFADTGSEKAETYEYIGTMNAFLLANGFPTVTEVQYRARDFKNWPEYHTLEENCLTNGTLPSEAFGFGSCSIKWKQQPQHKWMKTWQPALECWSKGGRVKKAIGFDCDPKEQKRTFRAGPNDDPKYDYWYPLQEWRWNRARCVAEIEAVGLKVPVKSSCFFCPNMSKVEVAELPVGQLQRIVAMEARAKPRLQKIQGLWRNGCKGTRGGEKRPGAITEFIREEGLLPATEIDRIIDVVPKEIMLRNEAKANGFEVETWADFFAKVGIAG